jgi:hypothetical protein
MKNRYGQDGHTYSVLADTSTGHFTVQKYQFENDEEEQTMTTSHRSNSYDVDVDKFDKAKILERFQKHEKSI